MRAGFLGRALTAIPVIAALVLGGALPAGASTTGSILLSSDGIHFSSALPGGVFAPGAAMIPGATRTATLWVKNDSTIASELVVGAAALAGSGRDLARSLTLQAASASTPGGAPASLDPSAGCATLLAEPLAAGDVTRLTLTLAMSDVGGQVAQGQALAAAVTLALREADTAVSPGHTSGCGLDGVQLPVLGLPVTTPGPGLAFTGSAIVYPALMAVGVLVLVGGILLLIARRRQRDSR
ncbi:hypothetical protein BH11ACT4_BH11ACT4_24530 [soil metagenome]